MDFRILGCEIEYIQAVKRLEELSQAKVGTLQAQERQELIGLFREFEKEIHNIKSKPADEEA